MDPPRAQAKRAQIRLAAQALFLAEGFERTTMDAITGAAGVSKQTLYHYYPSKEQLFADVLHALALNRVWLDVPVEQLEAAVATSEDLERVLLQIAQSLAKSLTDPAYVALVRVLIAEVPRFPHLAEAFWNAVPLRGQTVFSALLKRASACGLVSVRQPDLALRLFVGSLLTYLLDSIFGAQEAEDVPSGEQIAELVRMFMRAIS
jgi:TetR/AcrR family transcriptional regulator, mexJK operon transcriptional repressor